MQHGRLAQLVERLPYKQDVTGSSPVSPICRVLNIELSEGLADFDAIAFGLDSDVKKA